MRLTRNLTEDGTCKYAAIRNDKIEALSEDDQTIARSAMKMLEKLGVLENPAAGDAEEFFLIKLKDVNAPDALMAYAGAAREADVYLAADVVCLAGRAMLHPGRKQPD